MKETSTGLRAPVACSALTVAVCAAIGTSPAGADLMITPINLQVSQNSSVKLDFNLDGTPEYTVLFNQTLDEYHLDTFSNHVAGFNKITTPKPGTYANAYPSHTVINGSLNYVSGPSVILKGLFPFPYGEFGGDPAFAALQFNLPDGEHFGFVALRDPPASLTVIEIGYETEPNTGLVTPALPEPGTLALLAAGAAGVLALRRRKQAA
jgi:hypothetical protein